VRLWILLLALAACSPGDYRPARTAYNNGVEALAASDWATAESELLRARSEAGVDPELRWRAAFDLGLAYAGHAASVATGEPPDLEQALELYGKSAGWFQDAIRNQDDADARANLEIVRARQQAIADQLAAGDKALEKKLDQLIDGQRAIRDQARAILEQARAAPGSPTALEDQARAVATAERVLLADAGVVGDLAGAEVATIEGQPEDQRAQEDQVRLAQLNVLLPWVQIARTALADTRRMLDEGKHEVAHERAEEAVDALKRARETLLDPVEVLRAIGQDELEIAQQTAYLEQAEAQAKKLGGQPQQVPAWLTAAHLGGRQLEVRSRLDETKAMLAAASAQAPASVDSDPEQARMLASVQAALPDLEAASAAMTRASDALTTSGLTAASAAELDAIRALFRAMEQFMELRGVLDLAWQQQRQLVAMMTGEGEAATLPPEERRAQAEDGLERNLARITRVQALLVEEQAKRAAEAAQAATQDPAADPQAAAHQQQQSEALFAQAEVLRAQALAALQELAGGKGARPPLDAANDAQTNITELRKLFFDLIEHLQELIREQGETRDSSTEAAGLDDLGRAPLLPGLIGRQGEHRGTAQAIADALAAQADAATQQPAQPGGEDPAEQARKLGEAAEEIRAATGDMDDASGLLTKANDPAQTMSLDLAPALDSQQRAIDHLKAALQILQPPQQGQDQQEQQDQQDQQDQAQDPQQPEPKDESVDRRREQVREQEAQRRKEREDKARQQDDPVENDW